MARHPSKHLRTPRPLSSSFATTAAKSDGRWIVQGITAERAQKPYLCPGCNHDISVGEPHLVVWPELPSIGSSSAVDERRHWHGACWKRRR